MSQRIGLFHRLLWQHKQTRRRSARRPRSLSLERIGIDQLEARQMLSVAPWMPAAETGEQALVHVATPMAPLPTIGPAAAATTGTWAALSQTAPANIGLMLLLPDASVMAQDSDTSNRWFRLTPDASGGYLHGTWSSLAPMHDTRLYFSSQILPDGRVYVAGGEYGTGMYSAEIYNPQTDVWTLLDTTTRRFSDANSAILPDGRILQAIVGNDLRGTAIYDPAANTWTDGPTAHGMHNESAWVKLPDNSILFVDRDTANSERYIPATNTWVADAQVPLSLYDPFASETGSAFLLPDGRAFFVGALGHTAIYKPSGGTAPGKWIAGPDVPDGFAAADAPGAMMANGKILLATSPQPTSNDHFPGPTRYYEFDPVTNAFTAVAAPGGGFTTDAPAFISNMLDLPDGCVLYSTMNNRLSTYKPAGPQLTAGQPTVQAITKNADGTFHLTGTQLNGISEGACYGDDWQMATNYPIVRLTAGSNVFYARSYNWSSTGVMTGSTPQSTEFALPAGLPPGVYQLAVVANGIASTPVTIALPTGTTLPGAPSGLVAVAGSRQATLSWQAPAANGFPILDYAIESSADRGATWIPFVHAASAATSATVDKLFNGSHYSFRVAAINSAGRGDFTSTTTDTIPFDVPAAPTLLSAVAGPGQVSLVWVAPEVDGGNQITDYVVEVQQEGWNWTTWNDGVSANTATIIQPLQGNTAYSFRVAAVNAAGTGSFTEPSAHQTVLAVASMPTAPLNLVATPAGDAALLSWQTPASSGTSPIRDYSIHYSSDHAATWRPFAHSPSAATAARVTGLETGKGYLFRVAATSDDGSSVFAVSSVSLPAAPPPPPTLLVATAGAGSAVLSWQSPQVDGGSPLTGYALQSSFDGGLTWSQRQPLAAGSTSAVVNGLVGGQAISFRLAAVNPLGTGAYSVATAPVVPTVPVTVPAAPTNVVANAANTTQKWVSWNAPANGGSVIKDYTVQYSSNAGQTWYTVAHAPSAATAVLVSGLSTRIRYSFRVAAVNAVGTGAFASPAPPPSTVPVKPATVAGVPTKLTAATTGTGEKTLSWTAPASNGGSAITTYVVQYAAIGGGWVTVAHAPSTATSLVVSGLNPRVRYSFRVAAVNSVGTGAFVRA